MNSLFRVSERQHSGLILMTELAVVFSEDAYLSLSEIAARMKISEGYLEEIARHLKAAGLIAGRKGPGGGYRLMRSPDAISAGEIIEAIEGPLAFVDCQAGVHCPVEASCKSKSLWDNLQSSMLEQLNATMLSSIVT